MWCDSPASSGRNSIKQVDTGKGLVFNIQRYSLQDGPGIRTTVFLKGCPLTCPWCSNPESQKSIPEVAHQDRLCNRCGVCVEACELKAIEVIEDGVKIRRDACTDCGKCVEVCPTGALRVIGKEMSVEEVCEEVRSDGLFYKNSGGGVTASGGEPLQQADFVASLFERCKSSGIHTCLETSGFSSADNLRKVVEYTDLVLYDVKHMDGRKHLELLGVGNETILENIRLLEAHPTVSVRIRVPLVPGMNDSEENIADTIKFASKFKRVIGVDLLPYHRFGVHKYAQSDRPYDLESLPSPPREEVERFKALIEGHNLACGIGG